MLDDLPRAWREGHGLLPLLTAASTGGVWLAFLAAHRTRDLRVLGTGATEYRRVVSATAFGFGTLAVFLVVTGVPGSRLYFLFALPLGLTGLAFDRWIWRQWLGRQRQFGHYLSRAVVLGAPEDIEYVLHQIEKSGASYNVVETVFPDHADDVASMAQRSRADVVIVAGQPHGSSDVIRDLAWSLEGTATELVLAARLTDVAGPRIHFRPVEGLPLMHVELPQFEGGKHYLKRIFDIVAASAGVLVISPLIAVLCVLIRIDSPGAPFYRSERVGRDGRTFTMWKLRSMRVEADTLVDELATENDAAGPLFKLREDPRVTRLGRVLRKYSMDELPQLLNVVAGHMSLVGPRPPLPREVAEYAGSVHRRLYIKPGLTGMWQINGRSNLSWDESVRLDLYYVENWSLAGDLVILWRTVKVLIRPVGAY
jgi:exopolysaccharide biosynthesis polyprenyl glycosylphosphotransferase